MRTLRVRATNSKIPVPMLRDRIAIDPDTKRDLTMIYVDTVVEVPRHRHYLSHLKAGLLVEVPADTPTTKEAKQKAKKSAKSTK